MTVTVKQNAGKGAGFVNAPNGTKPAVNLTDSNGSNAQITGNTGAAGLAAQLQATAAALLPKFDTGYWSLYSLGGHESPLSYQDFVITLLVKLANRTNDTTWSGFATKLKTYETQAPVVNPAEL